MPEESVCEITTLRGLTRTLTTRSWSYPSVSHSATNRCAIVNARSLNVVATISGVLGRFRSMAVPQPHGVGPGHPPACPAPRCGRAAHSSRPAAHALSEPVVVASHPWTCRTDGGLEQGRERRVATSWFRWPERRTPAADAPLTESPRRSRSPGRQRPAREAVHPEKPSIGTTIWCTMNFNPCSGS
jgi:hypothetical protein